MSAEDWSRHQDPDGRVTDVSQLKQAIFKGARSHHLCFLPALHFQCLTFTKLYKSCSTR